MPRSNASAQRRLVLRAYGTGAVTSAVMLTALLVSWGKPGEPVPARLSTSSFSVAILAGPKQAAQHAPDNAENKQEDVKPVTAPSHAPVAVAQRETALPEAVAAAPQAAPSPEIAKPVEVIPPARVSMPGGRLMAEDASAGSEPDPFAVGPRQVYIRLLVNADGKVVRSGIVRGGTEPLRDALILKALASRKYDVRSLKIEVPGPERLWQLDQVIDYGTNDFLP